MLLAEPTNTAYDLHFSVNGIPVRVSPFFFLMTVLLGYDLASVVPLNQGFALVMWCGVCLVSILIHELGHSLAMRRYGIQSKIVLYHFGGLAISQSTGRHHLHHRQQVFISAAGPGIQLLFALAIILVLAAGDFRVPHDGVLRYVLPSSIFEGERELNLAFQYVVYCALQVNIYWALLNLTPIYPLDGGNISRELFLWSGVRDGLRYSLVLSLGVGIVVAVWAFSDERNYMGIMFAMLAFSSFQMLQNYNTYGGGWR